MAAGRIVHIAVIGAILCSAAGRLTVASPHAQRPIVSPEVHADRRVTFRLAATSAARADVVIASSPSQIVAGRGTTLPMRPNGDLWIAVSEPLTPDIYAYQFRIDGKMRNDPSNARFIEEIAGDRTSAFAIPGEIWTTTGAPAGNLARHSYQSAASGTEEDYYVYTPAGYDAGGSRTYPTLYLLHGMGDNAHTWITNGGVNVTLDNLIAQGKAAPMVVVMPLGYGGSGAALLELAPFERALLEEIVPQVEQRYRVSRGRDARAIAGVSMGGSQAMTIGLRHADTFAWLGSLSGAFDKETADALERAPAIDRNRFTLIYLGWGADDSLARDNREFAAALKRRGLAATTQEVPGIGHVWPLWRQMVGDLVQRLFK